METSVAAPILAVIPCLNEEKYIESVVRGLVAHTRDLPIRIVVADGGSTDRTVGIVQALAAEYPQVIYLHNPKRRQGPAVNLAVATHGQDDAWLIRLDAHASYPADYCQQLIAEATATGAAAVVVSMDTQGAGLWQQATAIAQNSKLGNGGAAHRDKSAGGKWVDHGHHALMRIDAFRAVMGYDETFSHNEDAELDHRLGLAGYEIWLTTRTQLVYYPRSTPAALFRQYFNFGHGRARTLLKHQIIPKLRQMIPAAVAPAAALLLITPFLPIAILPFLVWAWLCLAYGFWLALKTGNMRAALAGPAAMVMHAGWSFGFWLAIAQRLAGKL
jgi:succinoglycan biosynthesis protein ExoA